MIAVYQREKAFRLVEFFFMKANKKR